MNTNHLRSLLLFASLVSTAAGYAQSAAWTIPLIDLAAETHRQVIVDREPGQYLGHPTTVLLEDGKTMLCVYPKGHGRGAIVYKRSADGGLTWSDRLPTPKSWETSLEVPTLHRVVDAAGKKRVIMFSGLYPIRMAVTEDDGLNWSELKPIGDFGGVVTMASVIGLKTPGYYLAFFHDDGRFIRGGSEARYAFKSPHSDHVSPAAKPWRFWVYTTLSKDGGLTWSVPVPIAMRRDADLCEPGALRSPDGKQIAVLLRENARRHNSFVIFSDDEGLSWSEPRELPAALTGDRHAAKYAPDGRLFISFRDRSPTNWTSPTAGDWVAWVGAYEDIVKGREGQYRVRLMDNHKAADCAYPGVEVLPDGTFVTTTYGHWTAGEQPYIASVRLKLAELDEKAGVTRAKTSPASKTAPQIQFPEVTGLLSRTNVFVSGQDGYHTYRIPSLLATSRGTLLAFAEGRKQSSSDAGDIDLLLKRSSDQGRTWSPAHTVWDDGPNTCGNPCPVVDRDTGTIWLLSTWNRGEDREKQIIAKASKDTRRIFVTRSTDDGRTWDKPREITADVKLANWTWYATGPGAGIQMEHGPHRGRLVIPCDHIEADTQRYYSHAIYSDDRGQTWQLGGSTPRDQVNECEVVELPDGQLLLNMRNYDPSQRARQTAISSDGGLTWTDQRHDETLIEPICQASIRRLSWPGPGRRSVILFANPASAKREKLTIRASFDEGRTWSATRLLDPRPGAYSCLAILPDGSIGVLYEAGNRSAYENLVFARLSLEWLTAGGN